MLQHTAATGGYRRLFGLLAGGCWLKPAEEPKSVLVQSGARRRGIAGIHGNGGTFESATYRI
jgi:hypothetical protein